MLICMAPVGSPAETPATQCNPAISSKCSCTLPALERSLGPEGARFLTEIWEHAYSPDAKKSAEFFERNRKQILQVSIRYSEIKYDVVSECGALAFKDGYE